MVCAKFGVWLKLKSLQRLQQRRRRWQASDIGLEKLNQASIRLELAKNRLLYDASGKVRFLKTFYMSNCKTFKMMIC